MPLVGQGAEHVKYEFANSDSDSSVHNENTAPVDVVTTVGTLAGVLAND